MRHTYLISHTTAFLLFIVVASGCGGGPNPISYDDDSKTKGIDSPLTNPVVEDLSSVSDPVEEIDVPIETSLGVDGAALRVRIRKTSEKTTQVLRRVGNAINGTKNGRVIRLYREAMARWVRAQNALKRYIRNEGQRRDELLNGFFEQAEAARATAIQAALLARDS